MENKFEIVKSVSMKKNLGNYENFDVFVSMKEAFDAKPSEAEIERVAKELHDRCLAQVRSDAMNVATQLKDKKSAREEKKDIAELEFVADEDPNNEILA